MPRNQVQHRQTSSVSFGRSPVDTSIPSSPPPMPHSPSPDSLDWDAISLDTPRRSVDGVGHLSDDEDLPEPQHHTATSTTIRRSSAQLISTRSSSNVDVTDHLKAERTDGKRESRCSIFDWSEQPVADRTPRNRSPPRPSTVHGKKGTEVRGSRSVGRRAPSALHLRSQSVPVVPDVDGKREALVTNKFGTWGVGSKGVSEDWNDDFDFPDASTVGAGAEPGDEKRIDSAVAMVVPHTIREQQNNVLTNIGLLREWGLLIQELKTLRGRAGALRLLEGEHAATFQEVDAMIDLADQDANDQPLIPRVSPPSSPGFDMDAFDEDFGDDKTQNSKTVRKSGPSPNEKQNKVEFTPPRNKIGRRSILNEDDVFVDPSLETPSRVSGERRRQPRRSLPPVTRPRKDSEAVARSVIEALKNRKSNSESLLTLPSMPSSKKVPFDTATLKHIVPYVNGLVKKVKDVLREAECLYSSPCSSPALPEPSFNRIFSDPPLHHSSPSKFAVQPHSKKTPKTGDEAFPPLENDIGTQTKVMTVM